MQKKHIDYSDQKSDQINDTKHTFNYPATFVQCLNE